MSPANCALVRKHYAARGVRQYAAAGLVSRNPGEHEARTSSMQRNINPSSALS